MNLSEKNDNYFMSLALMEAQKAYDINEIPIGAVVVDVNGDILGCGFNQTESKNCQSRHAEVIAIEQAGNAQSDWRLTGCTIYITVEPCIMCFGLITLSRIERIVFGADSELFGFDTNLIKLPDIYQKHIKGITSGIAEVEAQLLIKKFFKLQREKR